MGQQLEHETLILIIPRDWETIWGDSDVEVERRKLATELLRKFQDVAVDLPVGWRVEIERKT